MRGLLLIGVVAWLLPVPVGAADGGPVEVAVMEFTSDGGLSEKQMASLEDLLATEIRRLGNFRVIGKSDIRAMLRLEQKKFLLGCTDDSCIAEIGGALGVRWVVLGNVGLFGSTYLLNIKLMDAEKILVAKSVSEKVKDEQDDLVEVLPGLVRELFDAVELTARPALEQQAERHPLSVWGHVSLWSGVGMAALGAVALWQGMEAGAEYDRAGDQTDLDRSQAWAGTMWAGFGLGAALVTTGIVLWALEPSTPLAGAAAAPSPDGRGVVLSVCGRW